MEPEVAALMEEARAAFAFLTRCGHREATARISHPESFKGGFQLDYPDGESTIRVQYLDAEVEVRRDGVELFGPERHPGFAGSMFSRLPFQNAIHRIAAGVRKLLPPPPILIAADTDRVREFTSAFLRSDGFRVETADSAVKALRRAEERRPARSSRSGR